MSSTFKKLYRMKGKNYSKHDIEKLDKFLVDLRNANEPEKLGEKKKGKLNGLRAHHLNNNDRALFSINRRGRQTEISLHKVCNHKQVYGNE